jgi:hypothetical protein
MYFKKIAKTEINLIEYMHFFNSKVYPLYMKLYHYFTLVHQVENVTI